MTAPMRIDCLVIGAGAAGLAAAREASRRGLEVLLVDERREIAGLRDAGLGPEATVLASSLAWSVFPDRTVSVVTPGDSIDVRPRTVVIATGAHDRLLPFRGWEHQSVVTGDEGLDLARTLSARMRWVVAGIGEQGEALARGIHDLGQDVLHADAAGEAAAGAAHASGVLPGHIITGVMGSDRIERVELAPARSRGTTIAHDADIVCVAYARAPRVDLTRLAGCAVEYAPDRGGAVPVLHDGVCTSAEGVLVVGEAAGLCRSETAALEGRLAGLMAAERLGRGGASGIAELRRSLITQISAARRSDAAVLADYLRVMRDLEEHYVREALERPDVHLCKCEMVPGPAVRAALDAAAPTPADLKRATRVGMGECQGMHCRWLIQKAVALRTNRSQTLGGMMTFRPPVRPITLAQLIGDSE
jgi:thioredoxin reductase